MRVILTAAHRFLRLRQPCNIKTVITKRTFTSKIKCFPELVSCENLRNTLESNDSKDGVVVLDVSWFQDRDAFQEYKSGHIPGAFYFNVLDGDHTKYLPRNIPTPEQLQSKARAVGINNDSQLVVYSDSSASGFFLSARAWWTFKIFGHQCVSILDGGLSKWKSLGFPISTDEPIAKEGSFVPGWNAPLYLSFEEMMKVDPKETQICDTRSSGMFSGPKSGGHIPGAYNIPMSDMVDAEKGVMKSKEELKEVFHDAGFDLSKPITMYCETGMTVNTVLFAALQCGCPSGRVYHTIKSESSSFCLCKKDVDSEDGTDCNDVILQLFSAEASSSRVERVFSSYGIAIDLVSRKHPPVGLSIQSFHSELYQEGNEI